MRLHAVVESVVGRDVPCFVVVVFGDGEEVELRYVTGVFVGFFGSAAAVAVGGVAVEVAEEDLRLLGERESALQ